MENSTKIGIGVGLFGVLALGVYAWYNDRKEYGLKKFEEGCSYAGNLHTSKYNELVKNIQEVKQTLDNVTKEYGQFRADHKAKLVALYLRLKENHIVSESWYQKEMRNLNQGSTESFIQTVKAAKSEVEKYESLIVNERALYEKSKIKGCICNKRFTSAGCILEICRPIEETWDMNLSEVDDSCWGEYEYRWPTHCEPIKREMNSISRLISSCWELLQKRPECIQEAVAQYLFYKLFSIVSKMKKWEEPSGKCVTELYHHICMEVIERCGCSAFGCAVAFDRTNEGQIYSSWLDHAILQECREVRSQIETWIDKLSDSEKRIISERMSVIDKFRAHEQVQGILIFHDGVPTIRFCGGINVRLALPDTPLYYEGSAFLIRKNRDLRKFITALIPDWNDSPIADHRVYAAINGFRKRMNDRGQRNNVGSPAEGAVREFLKFKDAAAAFFKQKLRALNGKPVMCEAAILKWNKASLLHRASRVKSAEITKMLGDAILAMQNDLNTLAKSHGALLYCYDDLFPDFKSRGYYVKWDCNNGNSSF